MKLMILILAFMMPMFCHAQSDLLKGSKLLLSGISIFKNAKSCQTNSKTLESLCVKNKFLDKITFRISGKDEDDKEIKKELVIQKEGKECLFELLKGIWDYEIILSNNQVYKKGQYKLEDEITITVKE